LEDKDRVFKNGPYFFNLARIYLRLWSKNFSREKEDFIVARVLIRMYSMMHKYWEEEILEGIGNALGSFVKTFKVTK
jgi:hypothetical protein